MGQTQNHDPEALDPEYFGLLFFIQCHGNVHALTEPWVHPVHHHIFSKSFDLQPCP